MNYFETQSVLPDDTEPPSTLNKLMWFSILVAFLFIIGCYMVKNSRSPAATGHAAGASHRSVEAPAK